jgi:hypothetical protein
MRKFLFSCTMLAAFSANAAADPFVSGSEPGWGKHLSPAQRRTMGFEDVPAALKAAGYDTDRKPNVPSRNVAGPGVPGYAFKLLTIRHGLHGNDDGPALNNGKERIAPPFTISQIISEPFGVFATREECDTARAVKIADLDRHYARFPHQSPNAHERVTHLQGGSVIVEKKGSMERIDVTYCEPGIYSPGPNFGIAKDNNIRPTPVAVRVPVEPTELVVPPGFVKQWVSPRPFTRVIPGTSEVIEVLSASGQELIFMVKPDIDLPPTTNILLVDDNGEVIANLKIVIPGKLNYELHRQGSDDMQVYRKDNPNYVAPKEKK